MDNNLIFFCRRCGFIFEEDENCKSCPNCDSTAIREANEEEYNQFLCALENN